MGGTQGSEEGQHGGSQKQLAKKPEISSLRHPPKDANPDLVKIEYSNL